MTTPIDGEGEVTMNHPPIRGTLRQRNERGEGVISTAIAVLIIAFLGIALWTGFDSMMEDATDRTRAQIEQIGG
jgi:type IV secretory pathway VirB2 component (pilin)